MPEPRTQPAPRWRDYAQLTHLEYAGFALAPLYGALSVRGAQLKLSQAVQLSAIFILFTIWANAHNHLTDLHWDRRSSLTANRPLASGRLQRRHAWLLVGVAAAANAVLVALFFPRPYVVAASALSWFFCILYNYVAKYLTGSDIFFAAAPALAGLFGALAVLPGEGRQDLSSFTWIVLAVVFLYHLYLNVVPGGLKDLGNDRASGIRTLAARCSRMGREGLELTTAFKCLALGLRAAMLGAVFVFVVLGDIPPWQTVLLALAGLPTIVMTLKLVNAPGLHRRDVEKYSKGGEGFSVVLLALLFVNVAGLRWTLFLMMIPFLWFAAFNYLIHGETTRLSSIS